MSRRRPRPEAGGTGCCRPHGRHGANVRSRNENSSLTSLACSTSGRSSRPLATFTARLGLGLFTEQTTGADALLEDTNDGYRLTLATVAAPPSVDLDGRLEVQVGVQRMDLATALDLLAELGTPLVLFVDSNTGRGRVVYRRYDGHYGTFPVPTGRCRHDL